MSSISGSDTESDGSDDVSSGDDAPSTSARAQRRAAVKDAGKLPQALYQTKGKQRLVAALACCSLRPYKLMDAWFSHSNKGPCAVSETLQAS